MVKPTNTKPVPDFIVNSLTGIAEADDILARLFRIICFELNIGPEAWLKLMERYVDKNASITSKSTKKSNFNRELSRNNMTFKVFVNALQFLGDFETTFTVTLKDVKTGVSSSHCIVLRGPVSKEDVEKLDKQLADIANISQLPEKASVKMKSPKSGCSTIHTAV